MLINVISVALGVALIALTLNDVFQSVVVPRAVNFRLRPSVFLWRPSWHWWPALAWRLHPTNDSAREDFLAFFAPIFLIALLILWTALLIAGYGFLFFGLRHGLIPTVNSIGESMYFAGTSMTTLGYGDIVGRSKTTQFFSVMAAVTGLGLFAIVTAFLFSLFGAFQSRETFIVLLGARTGVPPSGVDLLEIAGASKTIDDLGPLFKNGQQWAAQLMESHLAYPPLAYFRSSHDYQSWVGTLGVLLDAATLLMTTTDGVPNGQARIFYNLGRHATHDLANHLGVQRDPPAAGLERGEFDMACDRLEHAGFALRDRHDAWREFAAIRRSYASELNSLARYFQIPPLQWIGDRSPMRQRH